MSEKIKMLDLEKTCEEGIFPLSPREASVLIEIAKQAKVHMDGCIDEDDSPKLSSALAEIDFEGVGS